MTLVIIELGEGEVAGIESNVGLRHRPSASTSLVMQASAWILGRYWGQGCPDAEDQEPRLNAVRRNHLHSFNLTRGLALAWRTILDVIFWGLGQVWLFESQKLQNPDVEELESRLSRKPSLKMSGIISCFLLNLAHV